MRNRNIPKTAAAVAIFGLLAVGCSKSTKDTTAASEAPAASEAAPAS
jgi:hypothetical protein